MWRAFPRPATALLLLVLWLVVTSLTGAPIEQVSTIAAVVTDGVARQFAFASLLLAAAALLLRWPGLGFGPPRPGTLRLLWLPGLYVLVFFAAATALGLPPASVLLVLAANTLLAAFSEEVMFRGFLYTGLRDRLRFWPAVLLTSAVFGAIHVLNAFLIGNVIAAALQAGAAFMSGLLFLSLRLATGSLWPVILLHAAWNAGLVLIGRDAPPLEPGQPIPILAPVITLLFLLPLALYGLRLLRRAAREEGADAAPDRR